MTLERIRDDDTLRKELRDMTLINRRAIFKQLPPPVGDVKFSDADILGIQKSLMMKPSVQSAQPGEEPETDVPLSWGKVSSEALKNFDDSAIEYGKNLWQALRHPIQSGQQLFGLLAGAVEKAIPGGEDKHEKILMDTVKFFQERYGGSNFSKVMESIKKTIASDPVGFLSDLSIIITGGSTGAVKVVQLSGKLSKIGTKAVKGAAIATPIADKVIDIAGAVNKIAQKAQFLDPISGGVKLTQKGVGRVVKPFRSAESVNTKLNQAIQSSLKFDPEAKLIDNAALAQEMIRRGVTLTEKDLNMFRSNQVNLAQEMERAVDAMAKTGKKVPSTKIAKAFDNVLNDMEKFKLSGVDEPAFVKQLTKLKDEWLELKPEQLGVRAVQDMKKALGSKFDAKIGQEFGKLKNTVDDQQRRILSSIIEDIFPEAVEGSAKRLTERFTSKRGKGDFRSPDVKGSASKAGAGAINKEFGLQKDIANAIESVLNKHIVSPSSGSRGLVVGGAANVGVGLLAGFATGSFLVGAGSAISYTVMVVYLTKIIDNPALKLSFAKRVAKIQNIRISAAKKIVESRLLDAVTSATAQAQQVGRIANETK